MKSKCKHTKPNPLEFRPPAMSFGGGSGFIKFADWCPKCGAIKFKADKRWTLPGSKKP